MATLHRLASREGAWSLAWAVWLTATLGSFAWLEAVALRRRCHPTLTRTLRRWLGLQPARRHGPAALLGFASVWVWLVVHLARPRP